MRTYTNEQVIAKVQSLSTFNGWKKGIYDVWVRSEADAYDQFDDKAFTFEVETEGEKPKFIMARKGTTNAGSYGLKKFEDYNHTGCAVLKSDWMVYNSHTYGNHPLRGGKPAYRQAKSFPYYRDNNKNQKAEEIGKVQSGIIGANIHRAGVNSTVIKNWSTACMVTANQSEFLKFISFMEKKGKPPITLVILKEWNPADVKPKAEAKPPVEVSGTTQHSLVVEPEGEATPPPVVESSTTVETAVTDEGSTLEKTTNSNPTVTVKQQDASLWAKIIAVFGTITGLGFNAAELIQNKLEEISAKHLLFMVIAVGICAGGWYLWNKSKNRAHAENLKLIDVAADTNKNNVVLE